MTVMEVQQQATYTYVVLVNDEEQYSLWPRHRSVPQGWRGTGQEGTKEECLDYVERVWTDLTPKSLRAAAVDERRFTPWKHSAYFEVAGIPIADKLKSHWQRLAEEYERFRQAPERVQIPYPLRDYYSGVWLLGAFRDNLVERSYIPMNVRTAVVRSRLTASIGEPSPDDINAEFDRGIEEGLLKNRELCPVLESILDPLYPDYCVSYSYSTMKAGTRIAPHSGADAGNVRLHLCLKEAPDCWLTVSDEKRAWRNGDIWGFDDSRQHSAEHHGPTDRTILLMDFKQSYLESELRKLG